MNKVLAIIITLLAVTSCVKKQTGTKVSTPTTKLELFVDSIKKVYPNYQGNIAINKKIGEVFATKLTTIPGILEDEPFYIVGINEIADKYILMLGLEHDGMETTLSVWCEDFGEDKAEAMDKKKLYRLTGGTIEKIVPKNGAVGHFLDLGDVYVKDMAVEEIADSHYESPTGL